MTFARIAAAAAAVLAVAVTACSKSTDGTICPQLILAPPVLLYPIPGATGVPDAAGFLILGGVVAHGSFALVPSAGPTVSPVGPLEPPPSPLPSPIASTVPGTALMAAPLPVLGAATTYTVTFNPTGGGSCGPGQAGGSIGAFTTQ